MEQMGVFKYKEKTVKDRQASCLNRQSLGQSHESFILGQASADQNEKPGLSS